MSNPISPKYRLEDDFKNSVPLEGRDFVEEVLTKLIKMTGLFVDFKVKWDEKAQTFLSDRSKCNWETLDLILIHLLEKDKTIEVKNEKYLNPWPMIDGLNEILEEKNSERRFYLTVGMCQCIIFATKNELRSFLKTGRSLTKRY